MPAKGKTKLTDRQRAKIAAGHVVGKPARQIARETGLSKSAVDHHRNDPLISTLTLRLKRKDEHRLEQGWNLAVESILSDLKSKDSSLKIDARRDLLRYLTIGDPPLLRVAPSTNENGDFTLEELLTCYAKVGRG